MKAKKKAWIVIIVLAVIGFASVFILDITEKKKRSKRTQARAREKKYAR
ncbi:MAG: hypothetical protein ACLSD6_06920 [Clostridium sp.]